MYGSEVPEGPRTPRKITAPDLRARKSGERIVMVTAYDFTSARCFDMAGVDALLVGDSLGMIVQGLANTVSVTLDEMVYHTRCVARAARHAHVVGDLPFMTYQVSPLQAVESAGRLVKEGGAESVKLEGGEDVAEHIERIVRAGIPVMGHVGLTPQSVHALGGFRVQGRGDDGADKVLRDALAVAAAGAFAVVLEAIPPDLAMRISRELDVPTIGIGAGPACDGQVLVGTDMLGMGAGPSPKFVKRFAELGESMRQATQAFVGEVRSGAFPAREHCYRSNLHPPSNDTRIAISTT
jgi:3-methyl-2-oxobutanoate hydroxymethyltransferase